MFRLCQRSIAPEVRIYPGTSSLSLPKGRVDLLLATARTRGSLIRGNLETAGGTEQGSSPGLTRTLVRSPASRLHPPILTVKSPTPSIYAANATAFNGF